MNIETMTDEEIKAYEALHGCKLRREPREKTVPPQPFGMFNGNQREVSSGVGQIENENRRLNADIIILKRTNQSLIGRNDLLEKQHDSWSAQIDSWSAQIEALAGFILKEFDGEEPSRSESASETAIRMLGEFKKLRAFVDANIQSQPSTSSESPASE